LVGELVGIVEHISDITKRVEAEEALKESEKRYRELSRVDELTGLFNKRYFNRVLDDEIKRVERNGQPLSLIMMDIDNFKHHNDTYGHADGDKVLAQLGTILSSSIRTTDLACRYGGEEFVIILPSTAGEGGALLAERIRKKFAEKSFYPTPEEKVNKTLSLGITQFVPGDNIESFVKRADANLYKAKSKGKNQCILK
jgi:two-component system cell cycle response regulator